MAVNQDTSGGIVIVNLEPAGRAVQATFGGLDANRAHRLHNQVLAGEEKIEKIQKKVMKIQKLLGHLAIWHKFCTACIPAVDINTTSSQAQKMPQPEKCL